MLSRQVHPDATGPGGVVVTARTLEDAQIGVRSEPMFRDPGKEADTSAIKASKKFVRGVVGGNSGSCVPRKEFLTLDPG